MNREDFKKKLEEIMEIQPGSLVSNEQLSKFSQWDSMSVLSLISFIDREFNKKITMGMIDEFKTADDICIFLDIQ